MYAVRLAHPVDFEGWRRAARALRLAEIAPGEATWSVGEPEAALFAGAPPPEPPPGAGFNVPREFVGLAQAVICHADPGRFALLHRLLQRLRDEPKLLELLTDADVAEAMAMQKSVRQAEHKMHAFVRFRRVDDPKKEDERAAADPGHVRAPEEYFAWYEPPHFVIALGVDFFVRRLANVRFTIASPYVTVAWDGERLAYTPGGKPDGLPAEDAAEDDWRAYFASIFNPARLNQKVMTQHMARHYWKNLPEASLIPDLIASAQGRTTAMVEAAPTAPSERALRAAARAGRDEPVDGGLAVTTLEEVSAGVQTCRRCDLWRDATQGVAGQGPARAPLMFVGEQPGDMEDLAGRPFVGPAGQLFDRALLAAGVPREEAYVTNSVKHFKHELRGKRRIHQKPDTSEVRACNWWIQNERRIVQPKVVVALGATAATALLRKGLSVLRDRGPVGPMDDGAEGFLTVHPSFLLRLPDEDARRREFDLFVRDLAAAYDLVRQAA